MIRYSVSILPLILVPGMALASESVRIEFVDHITARMVEQDVYVPGDDAGKVFRVRTENAGDHSNAMVYRTAAPVEHAPMDKSKVGSYDAGAELGFTFGDWLSASGTGELTCDAGKGR